ncbi:hypothetical protein FEDK69T_17940 [Flavobacterium enshiense DK69]|uniref:hypothetical protein n=1 Tax=Flavobacterium enshiense TaxID=1341165 RepID=UPI0003C5ADBC|nr:hypothetical protein [Flavobacterium enshiense]ESU22889.1 hypothetical protein FEDK69T_17940 [Flavobacterium enshiense DK69]
MNRIFKIFGILTLGMLFANCEGDEPAGPEPARPHSEVYAENLAIIEEYLHEAYIDVSRNANGDVTSVVIDTLNPALDPDHTVSIWDQTEYPLQSKIVKLHGVNFKVYYLKLDNKGDTEADGNKPCGVDRVLTSYWGKSLSKILKNKPEPHWIFSTPRFDYAPNPVEFNLIDVVKGWEYMFPEFRAGFFGPENPDNPGALNSVNFGSGVMFLPSGLGYYNQNQSNIPQYAPLVFAFNLHAVTYLDQDFDKIESRYEYGFKSDGSLIDTDSDGIPDIFDADDDNDGYLTKNEIKHTITVKDYTVTPMTVTEYTYYYPFHGAVADDPATVVNEAQGIPDCSLDYTTSTRKRRHLDKTCRTPIKEEVIKN